eukprot:3161831-Rhodomonas_salina.3
MSVFSSFSASQYFDYDEAPSTVKDAPHLERFINPSPVGSDTSKFLSSSSGRVPPQPEPESVAPVLGRSPSGE